MASKRRSMAVTLGAFATWYRGVIGAMGEKRTPSIPGLMLAIAVKNGGTVSELAEIAATDMKTASRLLLNIRSRGWATVERDTKDERGRRVLLTPAGRTSRT